MPDRRRTDWIIGLVAAAALIYGPLRILSQGRYSAENWLDFVIFGLAQGSLYSLIALGYTLVYGILRMINFAHGEVFMSGAFTAYFAADALSRSGFLDSQPLVGLAIIAVIAAGTSTLIAVLLERIAYRPLRGAPRLVPLITAIGASLFLQNAFSRLYGSAVKTYPTLHFLDGEVNLGGVGILKAQLLVIVTAVLLMTGLYGFVRRTKTGRAMRAVSEDKATAALMGIDVDQIIVRTFIIGGSLAGIAGVLYALLNRQVQFSMGFQPGLKAFTAAVLGGIGNIPGAMLGGLFLGVVESLGPALVLEGWGIPAAHQLKDAIAFTLLVLVLVYRPMGILGEQIGEKKV